MTTTIKLVPNAAAGDADITLITAVSVTLAGRAAAPYPPGNVQINGAAFPSTTTGDAVLTWNHRYRLGPFIIAQDAGDVAGGPEGNYTIEVAIDGVLISTAAGVTGNTWTYAYSQRVIDNPDLTKLTTLTITPVNGLLSGTPRSLTFLMNP
jgi:hypothetical protein